MKNVTMDDPLTTQEIYDELFNFKEALKQLAGDFGELANGIMLSLAKTESGEPSEDLISRKEAFEVLAEILDENHVPIWICDKLAFAIDALPSADRPKDGDLISRADAIETIELVDWYHQNKNKDMIHGANSDEHQAWYKADDVYKALEAVPSANRPKDGDLISRTEAIEALGEEPLVWCDEEYEIAERSQWREDVEAIKSVPPADRPRGEWALLAEERPVDDYEIIATVYWPGYGDSIIAVGHIDRFDNWHLYSPTEGELIKGFEVIAWKTLPEPYKESDTE